VQQNRDQFHYRRTVFTVTISHSPITLANLSSINLVSIFRCPSPPRNPVYERRVDLRFQSFITPTLIFKSYIYLSLYRFIMNT
jgi:hypothetical protein